MKSLINNSYYKKKSIFNKFNLPTIGFYKIGENDNYWDMKSCCEDLYNMTVFIEKYPVIESNGVRDSLPRMKFCPFCGKEPITIEKYREQNEIYNTVWKVITDDK